jgi:hypothetical protein
MTLLAIVIHLPQRMKMVLMLMLEALRNKIHLALSYDDTRTSTEKEKEVLELSALQFSAPKLLEYDVNEYVICFMCIGKCNQLYCLWIFEAMKCEMPFAPLFTN